MKRIQLAIVFFISLFFSGSLFSQNIRNISWESDLNRIVINYDITSFIKGNTFNIQIFCSTDGGQTYSIPLRTATGDIGTDIPQKRGNTVLWDVYRDVGGLAGMVSFKVVAERNPIERDYYISYNGSLDAPFGIKVGMIGGISPYLGIRANQNYNDSHKYIYDNTSLIKDYPYESIYFIYGDEVLMPRYSVTAGINAHVMRNAYFYLGGGYGVSKLLWEVNEYNYNDDSLYEINWAVNEEWSEKGLELEGGLIIPIRNLLLNAGVTTINLKRPTATFGIGYRFK